MNEKQALLSDIAKLSFAQHDTVLYLDTHPEDTAALDYYNYTGGLLREAQAKFIAEYGPLTERQVNSSEYFTWVDGKWPWEGGLR